MSQPVEARVQFLERRVGSWRMLAAAGLIATTMAWGGGLGGSGRVEAQQPRTQQLLGWYTRVVTSLDEFYRPADQRLYRSGQG